MTKNTSSVNELMNLERESFKKQVAKDFDWMKEHHTKNAMMFPPNSKALKAQLMFDAANERKRKDENTKSTFYWEPTAAFVSEGEDMGYVYGITRSELENGEFEFGKYVSVWVKENGKWKVAAEIRNNDS